MDRKKVKRNPADATFRNINALKKRVKRLEQWMGCMTLDLNEVFAKVFHQDFNRSSFKGK